MEQETENIEMKGESQINLNLLSQLIKNKEKTFLLISLQLL